MPNKNLSHIKLCLLLVFLCFNFIVALGQKYVADKVEGLPKAEYYNCVQDEQGYMLFATDAGLVRWDGRNAVVYDNTNKLPSNLVLRVEKLQKGVLVFVHGHGIFRYEKGEIYEYAINREVDWLRNEAIFPQLLTYKNKIIMGVENEIIEFEDVLFSRRKKILLWTEYVRAPDGVRKNEEFDLLYFSVRFHQKSFLLKAQRKEIERILKEIGSRQFDSFSSYRYSVYNWNYEESGFSFLNIRDSLERTKCILFKGNRKNVITDATWFIYKLSDVNIISLKGKGLYRIDAQSLKMFPMSVEKIRNIYTIQQSNDGLVWLCAGNDGVALLHKKYGKYLMSGDISMIHLDTQTIFVGKQSGEFMRLKEDGLPQMLFKSRYPINDFCRWGNKVLLSTAEMIDSRGKMQSVAPVYRRNLVWSYDSLIYFGQPKEIYHYRFNKEKKTAEQIYNSNFYIEGTPKCKYRVSKEVWLLGSSKGLLFFNAKLGTCNLLKGAKNIIEDIRSIVKTQEGYLVSGLNTIWFYNGELSEKIINVDFEKGISINVILKLDNTILVGTNKGCLLYKKLGSKWSVSNVLRKPRFLSDEVVSLEAYNGYVYVGTSNGLLRFKKETIFSFQPRISSIRIGEVFQGTERVNYGQKARTSDRSFIRIILNMVDLSQINPKIHYEYRIVQSGSKNAGQWIKTDNPEIIASNLSHGSYTIQIHPLIFGLENPDEILEYSFNVVAPFYRRQSFFWMIGALFFGFLLYGVWAQIKITRTNNRLSKTQISLLRGALNPHMVFNSLNTLQNLFIGGKEKQAAEQIGHFTKFLRYNLNNYSLNLVTVENELKNLEHYLELEKIRSSGKLNYSIKHENIKELTDVKIPSLILQPIAENSVVHGSNKKGLFIEVELIKKEESLILSIADNGGGIKNIEKFKKEGHGLTIVDQIILFFNKTQKTKISTRVENAELRGDAGLVYHIIVKL